MPAIREPQPISLSQESPGGATGTVDVTATKRELERAAAELETASPQEILRWSVQRFRPGVSLACSFGGLQTMAVLHMLHGMDLLDDVEVFYNDTGVLFPETHQTRLKAQERYGFRAKRVEPRLGWEDQRRRYGGHLYEKGDEGIDRCCGIRKVAPVKEYLAHRSAWITGLRRSHSRSRAEVPVVQWDDLHGLAKINPVATMSDAAIEAYIKQNDIPYNVLYDEGYKSIGCNTPICTVKVKEGADPRSGRWVGTNKTECGLHLDASQVKSLDSSKL